MSYIVDTHALRPRHQRREQCLMCASTLNNVFSEHVFEKKHEHLSSGDELWVSDVENRRTSGPMMSKIGSMRVPHALLRHVDTRPNLDKNRAWDFICFLALPNGTFLCSRDQQVLHFENDATQNLDFEKDYFHVIVNLLKAKEELRTRTVSVAQEINKSIELDPFPSSGNFDLPVIGNIKENSNVKIGDLIHKVLGETVVGKSREEVLTLIHKKSYLSTLELEISDPEACVANTKIKSVFVYPNNSVVFVSGNKLALRNYPLVDTTRTDDRITPLAGHEDVGYVNGKGVDARFKNPCGVIVNQNNGDVIVADSGNHAIRLIKSDGTVTTLAGAPPREPRAVSMVHSRARVDADIGTPPPEAVVHIRKNCGFYDGTGSLARFNTPTYLAWDNDDSIVVVDSGNHSVRRVTMQGVVSTVAGGGVQTGKNLGECGVFDGNGIEARFRNPGGVVVDSDGTIVVADTNNNRLCKIVGNKVTTVVSSNTFDDGTSTLRLPLHNPCEMTLQMNGKLFLQPRPGHKDHFIVIDLKLKEPAWFKMYREGVRRRWLLASCLMLGMLKRADQSVSPLDISEETSVSPLDDDISEETATKILLMVKQMFVDKPSFLDEHSKGSLLNTVQEFFRCRRDEQIRRALLRKAQLAAPEDNAQYEPQ